ncbi:MAG: putative Zn finger protein [Candidatus Endobugula sp.]
MNISIKAKSSRGDASYTVDFMTKDGVLSVFCDCPAGEWGKFCKHKWQLLNGDESMLTSIDQSSQLKIVHTLAIEKGIHDLYKDVDALEKHKKILAKEQKKEKDSMKKALSKKHTLTEEQFFDLNASLSAIDTKMAYTGYLITKEKEVVEKKLKSGF